MAQSLPLGAGRLTREHLAEGLDPDVVRELRRRIRADIARDAGSVLRQAPDHAVATSKTFRSLARICGAAPSGDGPLVRRVLDAEVLRDTIPKLLDMSAEEVAELPGVSPSRAHQIVAGALVADAVLDLFDLAELEICPWALREGIILERLDRSPLSASPAVADQVGVLRVPVDVAFTNGHSGRTVRPPADVVEGAAHQPRADALPSWSSSTSVWVNTTTSPEPVRREAEHGPVGSRAS